MEGQEKKQSASHGNASQVTPSVHTVVAGGKKKERRPAALHPQSTLWSGPAGLKSEATPSVHTVVAGKEHKFDEASLSPMIEAGGASSSSTDRPSSDKACETWQEKTGRLECCNLVC